MEVGKTRTIRLVPILCPYKMSRDSDTEEKPREDEGRDGRAASTSPGMPGAPRSWKRQEGPSPGASALSS